MFLVNESTKKLEVVKQTKQYVQSDGTIIVDLLKSGSYIVLKKYPSKGIAVSLADQIKANVKSRTMKVKTQYSFKVQIPKTLEKVSSLKNKSHYEGRGEVTVTYKSSNSRIAEVSKTGVVKAKRKGTVYVTATVKLYNGSKKVFKKKIRVK